MPATLSIRTPDDWHVHLRDGAMLAAVGPLQAVSFRRALVMPNLTPPVTSAADAAAYAARIRACVDGLEPILTGYLTDHTEPDDVAAGFSDGAWRAMKLYPANATTNSSLGVRCIEACMPVLERMAELGMPLCVHGEVTDPTVDVFDREAVFIETSLAPLVARLPSLRVVFEHATTADAVAFVRSHPQVAATITPHHLWWNRNAIFAGGLRPHAYCLPVLKRERHRAALVDAATSGSPQFFLGTDSAPHPTHRKESDCGCAGVFSAPTALSTYAEVFEQQGLLGRLEGFASVHGAAFYGLPVTEERLTLVRDGWDAPETVMAGAHQVRVFRGGERLPWRVAGS